MLSRWPFNNHLWELILWCQYHWIAHCGCQTPGWSWYQKLLANKLLSLGHRDDKCKSVQLLTPLSPVAEALRTTGVVVLWFTALFHWAGPCTTWLEVMIVELGNWEVTERTGWIMLVYERQQHGHKYLLREKFGIALFITILLIYTRNQQ